jgi:hypothetical protein
MKRLSDMDCAHCQPLFGEAASAPYHLEQTLDWPPEQRWVRSMLAQCLAEIAQRPEQRS